MAIRTADTLKQFEAEYEENPLMVEAVSELDTTIFRKKIVYHKNIDLLCKNFS
jgi:hypothetical protein